MNSASANSYYYINQGTWPITTDDDIFTRGRFPTTTYLPPGTIIFQRRPNKYLEKYVDILPQNGFWVSIKEETANEILIPLPKNPPSASLILHEDIICLEQANHFVAPNEKCSYSNYPKPLGRGWIYSFTQKQENSLLSLQVNLTNQTEMEVKKLGMDAENANFKASRLDLNDREKSGYLTMLDRDMPLYSFKKIMKEPYLLKCGTKKITSEQISKKIEGSLDINVGGEFVGKILSFIGLQINASSSVSGANEDKTNWIAEIDTTTSSYLYDLYEMTDHYNHEKSTIYIEKHFSCKSGAKPEPDETITSVKFEIRVEGDPDADTYTFRTPSKVLATPSEFILNNIPRPVFISINSPSEYQTAIQNISKNYSLEMPLANFFLHELNYSCRSKIRSKCEQ